MRQKTKGCEMESFINKVKEIYPKAEKTQNKIIVNNGIEIFGDGETRSVYTQSGLRHNNYLLGYGCEKYVLNLLKAIKG